ncbi:hypothetical protein B484DRAFT_444417 [Ochromonadaceae sp. CCMP2298]|nr:hypothetical protein B484DRAFT_444417 [Ochromonadaceae sp. CCMP2298]
MCVYLTPPHLFEPHTSIISCISPASRGQALEVSALRGAGGTLYLTPISLCISLLTHYLYNVCIYPHIGARSIQRSKQVIPYSTLYTVSPNCPIPNYPISPNPYPPYPTIEIGCSVCATKPSLRDALLRCAVRTAAWWDDTTQSASSRQQ